MVDLIRRRLIDEALNYDKHINAAVFDIEKKQVAKYTAVSYTYLIFPTNI